jgi:3-hydroxybutyrate dehydrogenase
VNEKTGSEHAKRLGGDFLSRRLEQKSRLQATRSTKRLKKHGTVHVLVNNAGYQHVSPIEDFPEGPVGSACSR